MAEENNTNADSSTESETNLPMQNGDSHSGNTVEISEVESIDTIVQECSKEYADIDKTLDQLDTWMNKLEDQNDNLYGRIDELLESNRQIKRELQEQNQQSQQQGGSDHKPEPMDQGDAKS
ncbi:UPF0184 protein-like [Mizuhopecten yessoensis]|uniref:UPF0184 protein C9orf16-like n=1 Tax=Mizuhopecten yessoensis TaxID=6573 RepID=A0A210Q1N1_MIZYE|nr:UPF0184 protein-like [Mizuhopecten yessoensis]OWF42653.1 UPF0184 protein C9orf16-like [Mizuhopecten yessoensis]